MSWMQRLERVFAIEIERCRRCGGRRPEDEHTNSPFTPRAPPQPSLF
jgi:hypothetical protein